MKVKDLEGLTIEKAEIKKISDIYDDTPYLDIEFTNGLKCRIVADYGSYTGDSEDEYPRRIYLEEQ